MSRRSQRTKATEAPEAKAATDSASASSLSSSPPAAAAAAPSSSGVQRKREREASPSPRKPPLVSYDKKKRKTQPRCSSPSHFLVPPEEEAKYGPEFLTDLPDKVAVDAMLRAVANLYYHPKDVTPDGANVFVSSEYDSSFYPTLDLLQSPLRKPSVLDSWCPRDIALFEAGICAAGKDFHQIQKWIPGKTTAQVVDFYYTWKKSAHYHMWKSYGKRRSFNEKKEPQWQAVQEKMKDFDKRL